MKKILVNFVGMILVLFGAFTAIAIVGIPILILGNNLIDYSKRGV